jgi:hypothetical protein
VSRAVAGAQADFSFESPRCPDAFLDFVRAFVDAAEMSARAVGLGVKASLVAAFGFAFESTLARSFALGFSGGAMGAGDLKARSSCVDMEFSSLASVGPGVDTKDLVAADVLASWPLVVAGLPTVRAGMD